MGNYISKINKPE
jgi:hypothetical protein